MGRYSPLTALLRRVLIQPMNTQRTENSHARCPACHGSGRSRANVYPIQWVDDDGVMHRSAVVAWNAIEARDIAERHFGPQAFSVIVPQ